MICVRNQTGQPTSALFLTVVHSSFDTPCCRGQGCLLLGVCACAMYIIHM